MRLFISVLILHLAVIVSAGGYQGCLERIQLYEAYQIDEFNAPADRKIGFRCRRWVNNGCQNDEWEECRGRNGRCNFDELVFFLRRAPQRVGYTVLRPGTNRLDQRASALACFRTFKNGNTKIADFPPNGAMKIDVNEFSHYVRALSAHVTETYQRLAGTLTPQQNALFADIEYTADRIVEARTGDHGYWLLDSAREEFERDGWTIRVQQINGGVNPAQAINPDLNNWETVDWGETIKQRPSHITQEDALTRVRGFLDEYYSDNKAKGHIVVIRSQKYSRAVVANCRRA